MKRAEAKAKVMVIMSRHVGREKAIGMGELYSAVYDKPWRHRINDTRDLRKIITELRYEGALIGETRNSDEGGYYQARSAHELAQFFDRRKKEAIKKLYMIARMQRIGLAELLGQLAFSTKAGTLVNDDRQPTADGGKTNGGCEQGELFDGSERKSE